MLRRDLLATIASLVPLGGVHSLVDDAEAMLQGAARAGDDDGTAGGTDGPTTETRTAVVDRLEGDTAVLLFEEAGVQETVRASVLPEAAREPGVVLRVPGGDSLALATVDRAATAERREAAQERFDELSEPAPASNATASRTEG